MKMRNGNVCIGEQRFWRSRLQTVTSLDLPLSNLPAPVTPCGGTSDIPGFTSGTSNGNNVPFQIETSNPNGFSTEAVLCFEDGNGDKHCYKININVPTPCVIQDCIELTSNPLECTFIRNPDAIYNYSNNTLFDNMANGGYSLCSGNNVSTDIGSAEIIPIVTRGEISYIIKLFIPCEELERTSEVNLTITFCKEDRIICYTIKIPLIACEYCRNVPRISKSNNSEIAQVLIYPNPAHKSINVEIDKSWDNSILTIYDLYGKSVLYKTVNSGINTIDISNLINGLYNIKLASKTETILQKLIISN